MTITYVHSFSSLYPPDFINSVPTGMSVCSLVSMLFWIVMTYVVDYQIKPLALLITFNGLVIVSMVVAIFLFFYLLRMPFSKEFVGLESKNIVKISELRAVFIKIWRYSVLITSTFYFLHCFNNNDFTSDDVNTIFLLADIVLWLSVGYKNI